MEKRLLIFLVLAVAIFWIWAKINPQKPPAPQPATEESGSPSEDPAQPGGTTGSGGGEAPVDSPKLPPKVQPKVPVSKGVDAGDHIRPQLHSSLVRWEFDSRGGGVARASLKKYATEPSLKEKLDDPESWYPVLNDLNSNLGQRIHERSLVFQVIDAGNTVLLASEEWLWKVEEQSRDRLVYSLDVEEMGVRFTKTFVVPRETEGLEGPPYHLDFDLALTVTDAEKAKAYGEKGWRIRLIGPASVPREPFDLKVRVVGAVLTTDRAKMKDISPPGKPDSKEISTFPESGERGENRRVEWYGLHSRFFAAILKADSPEVLNAEFAAFRPRKDANDYGEAFANLSSAVEFVLPLPEQGATVSRGFLFYAGPMDPEVFDEGPYQSFASIIDYGIIAIISKLLVFLLGVIQSVVGNWGVAIIFLTLFVRMAMFPLSRKSQVSMQKYQRQMGRLKPKIDALKEQHKNNKKKLQEAQMKLMRDEGVSMVPKGCLVIFLQMPIFIGLFQALRYSIGLRHEQFLWAKDLTAPECLVLILRDHNIPLLWDPFYLNIFPILMGITWYLSAAMAPKATDPQQAQQQKMMKWMPVIFSLFLYNYQSGLALYMVVSSTWSIFEMKVVRKILDKPDQTPVTPAASPAFRKGR